MYLSQENLDKWDCCPQKLSFFKRNCLVGYPLKNIWESTGDYYGYITWIKERVTEHEIQKYTYKNNNLIKYENGSFWFRQEFQDNLAIKFWDADGYSWIARYDDLGNRVFFSNSEGYSYSSIFQGNNQISYQDNDGDAWIKVYKNSLPIRHIEPKYSWETSYAKGNPIYWSDSSGKWKATRFRYNKETYYMDSTGFFRLQKYNSSGDLVRFLDASGFCSTRTYDISGNNTGYQDTNGYYWETRYDSKGNIIWYKELDSKPGIYSYEFSGNILRSITKNSTKILKLP